MDINGGTGPGIQPMAPSAVNRSVVLPKPISSR